MLIHLALNPLQVVEKKSRVERPIVSVREPSGAGGHNARADSNPFSAKLLPGGSSTDSLSTLNSRQGREEGSRGSDSGLSVEEPNLTSGIINGYIQLPQEGPYKKPIQNTHNQALKKLENAGIRATVKAQMAAAKKLSQGGLGRSRRRSSKKARKTKPRKTRRR